MFEVASPRSNRGLRVQRQLSWLLIALSLPLAPGIAAPKTGKPQPSRPTVTLTAPASGTVLSTVTGVTQVELTATASDADGRVTRVEFFQNGAKLGEDTTAPYSLLWSGASPGSYSLTAVARDDKNNTGQSAAVSLTVQAVAPAAPGALKASAAWDAQSASALVGLSWAASQGATSYNLYRDGLLARSGVGQTSFSDAPLPGGRTCSYRVSAVGPGGESPLCSVVTVTTPQPSAPAAPASLAAAGGWNSAGSAPQIDLSWSAVDGALSYNVYRDGTAYKSGVNATSFADAPLASGEAHSYRVSAVGPGGESALSPSASATAPFARPVAPATLQAVGAWNSTTAAAEINVSWSPVNGATSYTVYRDGVAYKSGLTDIAFKDTPLVSGTPYTYRVSAVGPGGESPQSAAATATAPSAPNPLVTELKIAAVVPNDDSAEVTVMPFPGATDYRIYVLCRCAADADACHCEHSHAKKYSGGNARVEWNGIPAAGVQVVVEAVDRLGPFQYMDDLTPHDQMKNINGHGASSVQPVVLAQSQPFWLFPKRHPLRDTALFFDGGEDDTFTRVPFPQWGLQPTTVTDYAAYESSRYLALLYACDVDRTRIFNHNDHLMTIVADGPTFSKAGFSSNNYASAVLLPKAQPLLGNNVLHFSFEVDPHLSTRRWLEVLAFEADTPLLKPNATRSFPQVHPTGVGQHLVWQIDGGGHTLDVAVPGEAYGDTRLKIVESNCLQANENFANPPVPLASRIHWNPAERGDNDLNGTTKHLDLRRRFDLYISRTHYRVMEGGQLIKQGAFAVPLRFNRVQFGLTHMVYHSALEHEELKQYAPHEKYWIERTPYHDERHWDNVAIEALPAFPAL